MPNPAGRHKLASPNARSPRVELKFPPAPITNRNAAASKAAAFHVHVDNFSVFLAVARFGAVSPGAIRLPAALQDAEKAHIALVAGIFVEAGAGIEGHLPLPRLRIVGRVIHFEFVENLLVVVAREALGDLACGRDLDGRTAARHVHRLDDQRVAVPPADRIAHPRRERLRPMLGVERNDARVVDHLGFDHHMVRRLHDPKIVVVQVVPDWRA